VPDVQIGDYVVVHVGFAISTIDEQEAMEVFAMLKDMGELADLDVGVDGGKSVTVASCND
jgi:hydrogenase expression/formation protein HypC